MLGRLKYTVKLLVPEPGSCETDMITEKFKQYKSPRTDQIPIEIIPADAQEHVLRYMSSLILLEIRKNCLDSGRSQLLYCL